MIDEYIRLGWKLVPIPPGTKGPRLAEWNLKENTLSSELQLPHGYGVGIAHAYSGTMALDIDDYAATLNHFLQFDINLESLINHPQSVLIYSGKPGRAKLLYRMPFGMTLPSKKKIEDGKTIFELRCATSNGLTVQDVLPPTIHPETMRSYQWAGYGHWSNLPTLPQKIIDYWVKLLSLPGDNVSHETIPSDWKQIIEALKFIPSDISRSEWIDVGMALHWFASTVNEFDIGFNIWDKWSAKSKNKYPGQREIQNQWRSFKADKHLRVTTGSLFRIAREYGYYETITDISTLFKNDIPLYSPQSLGFRPPSPSPNMDLFPPILASKAKEISETVGCDPLVPLFAGIGAICGAVDARIRLELMPGFSVPPILWLMTIGDPGDKKTPGSKPMMKILKELELEDRPRFKKDLLDWEGKEAMHHTCKKAFLDFAASGDALMGFDNAPFVPDLPPQPVPLRISVNDITSQKLVRSASERPRGLLCFLDEMGAWVRKICDRSSGEDRSSWVVSYEGEHYEMDRVGAGQIHCENLAVSIYGNIQPAVIQNNIDGLAMDGLIQRFIPAVLNHDLTRRNTPKTTGHNEDSEWEFLVRLLFSLPARTYQLSDDAYHQFREFQTWYEHAKKRERLVGVSDIFMTAFGKIEGTAGRLMLIFHLIESPFNNQISGDIARRVIELIKTFVIPSIRYTYSYITSRGGFEEWCANYLIQHSHLSKISLSEIKAGAKRTIEKYHHGNANSIVIDAMDVLESMSWVKRIDDGKQEFRGIAEWAINPLLEEQFKERRAQIVEARQAQLDEWFGVGKVNVENFKREI